MSANSSVKDMIDRKPFAPEIVWECGACGADFPGEEPPPHCYNCVACGYGPETMRLHKRLASRPDDDDMDLFRKLLDEDDE
jgi:hypothetical protein